MTSFCVQRAGGGHKRPKNCVHPQRIPLSSAIFTQFWFYTFKNIAITINYVPLRMLHGITLIFRDFLMGSKGSELDNLTMVADLSHWINVAETDCNDLVKR